VASDERGRASPGSTGGTGQHVLIEKMSEAMGGGEPAGEDQPFPLPTGALAIASVAGVSVVAIAAALAGPQLGASAAPRAALWGGVAAGIGTILGLLVVRPWKARPLGQWPFALLAGQGATFLGVLFSAAAVYFSARPGQAVFAVVCAGGFLGALLAQAAVYSPRLRASAPGRVGRETGPPPA
jgi:hypothetical protein